MFYHGVAKLRTLQLRARATKVILLFIEFSGRVFLRRIKNLA